MWLQKLAWHQKDTLMIGMAIGAIATGPFINAQNIHGQMVAYSSALLQRAEAGNLASQTALGIAYLQGHGTPRRYDQAVLWFQKASMQGDADATGWLGGMYLSGQGVLLDTTKGSQLIEESRAAGSPVGLRYTALESEKGIGRSVNLRLALKLYEVAAGQGDAVSCDRIGLAYQVGRLVPQDLTKASNYFQCGASKGYTWAQLHLGEMYASTLAFRDFTHAKSKGSEPWLSEAYQMYVQAADNGNRVAAFRAGESLRDGKGVSQDNKAAEARLFQASSQQYAPAQEALADLYQQHPELGRTKIVSLVLYREAAAGGQKTAAAKASALAGLMSATEVTSADQWLVAIKQSKTRFAAKWSGISPNNDVNP